MKRLALLLLLAAPLGRAQSSTTFGNITLQSAGCSGAGAGYVKYQLPINSAAVAITLSSTWSGTVQFVASVDGSTWNSLSVTPSAGGSAVTSATANGSWSAGSGGNQYVCAYESSRSSGTVAVSMGSGGVLTPSSGSNQQLQYNNNGAFAGASFANYFSDGDYTCLGADLSDCAALYAEFPFDQYLVSQNHLGVGIWSITGSTADQANLYFLNSEGTFQSPLPVAEGDTIAGINFSGWEGSTWASNTYWDTVVDDTVTTGNVPMRFIFAGQTQNIFQPFWTNSGKVYNALELDITDTGSDPTSSAIYVAHNSTSVFSVSPTGNTAATGTVITGKIFQEPLTTPASSSAPCTAGQFTDDANYHYVCTATNTWKRAALSTF